MVTHFWSIAAVVGYLLAFASPSDADDGDGTVISVEMTYSMAVDANPTGSCFEDVLRDREPSCIRCGWEGERCEVQRTTTKCTGRGIGACACVLK